MRLFKGVKTRGAYEYCLEWDGVYIFFCACPEVELGVFKTKDELSYDVIVTKDKLYSTDDGYEWVFIKELSHSSSVTEFLQKHKRSTSLTIKDVPALKELYPEFFL